MRMKKSRKEIESSELNKGIALVANSYGSFFFLAGLLYHWTANDL